jgi:hypothetical protein
MVKAAHSDGRRRYRSRNNWHKVLWSLLPCTRNESADVCNDGSVESEGGSGVVICLGIWNFESTFVAVNEPVICGWIASLSGIVMTNSTIIIVFHWMCLASHFSIRKQLKSYINTGSTEDLLRHYGISVFIEFRDWLPTLNCFSLCWRETLFTWCSFFGVQNFFFHMDDTTFPGYRPPNVHSGQRKLSSDQIFLGLMKSPRSIRMKKRAIESFNGNFWEGSVMWLLLGNK